MHLCAGLDTKEEKNRRDNYRLIRINVFAYFSQWLRSGRITMKVVLDMIHWAPVYIQCTYI